MEYELKAMAGLLASVAVLACSAATVKVDPACELGPVKPVNGVGQPPFRGFREFPMFKYLKDAGIPFSRHVAGS